MHAAGGPHRLLDRLAEHARIRPNADAFRQCGPEAPDRAISYGVLAERVASFATALTATAPGAVVLLSCPNRVEFPVAYLAVLASGGVIMPVHPRLPPSQLLALARQVSAGVVIGPDESLGTLQNAGLAAIRLDDLLAPGPVAIARGNALLPPTPVRGPALLLQSSGTTGLPKVAIRSGDSLDAVARAGALAQTLTPDDRVLVGVPLCHSYGMEAGLLAPVFAGCSVLLMDGFDAPVALRDLRAGATVFPGVPFMFEALSLLAAGGVGASLRMAFSAGGPMPTAVAARFREYAGLGVGQLYGATELGWVTFDDARGPDHDPATVGVPMPGASVLILDPAEPDPRSPLAPNVEGQVAVATPSMLSGYLDAQAPMVDDYFLTGDLGRLDGRGRLTLTGRLKLLIDVGGLKVNPVEVEQVLLQHPGVGECVVVPIRMSQTVERIRAVVTPVRGRSTGSLSPDNLRHFASAHLAPHKVPRVFDIRDSLPRSPAGKVLRGELEGA